MKKSILIVITIALLTILLTVRIIYRHRSGANDERKWFVKSLRYEFSARVDSVRMFNQNAGRLRCLLTKGDPHIGREDSLKRLFKHHDMLYLVFKRSRDSITFVLTNHASLVTKGDSLRVSSSKNRIQLFHEGKLVATDSLTETLTGFSRPFPFKKK